MIAMDPAYEVHGHRENGEVFSIAVLGRLPVPLQPMASSLRRSPPLPREWFSPCADRGHSTTQCRIRVCDPLARLFDQRAVTNTTNMVIVVSLAVGIIL